MLPSAARRDVAVDQRDATSRQQLGGCLHKGQRSTRPGAVDEARTMLFRTLGPTLPSCLSPHACDSPVKLLKYADDTTLIGLIQDGDETAYRQEVERLVHWCSQNHLELKPLKTVEMTVDFRRDPSPLLPLTIRSNTILSTDTFKFLGTTISRDMKWTGHIDSVRKKAQQRLYFLRQLKKFNLPRELLKTFYTAIMQSVLCTSITVWFGSDSKQDKHRLQRTIRTAEKIIGINLPSIQDSYLSRTRKRARNISTDPSHPGCSLFELPFFPVYNAPPCIIRTLKMAC
ncbi:uncharacterized protein ACBT44_007087 isoform 1-T1 [Syngnathus typhle]